MSHEDVNERFLNNYQSQIVQTIMWIISEKGTKTFSRSFKIKASNRTEFKNVASVAGAAHTNLSINLHKCSNSECTSTRFVFGCTNF